MNKSSDYIDAMMRQYRATVWGEKNKDTDTLARLGTPEEFVRGLLEQIEKLKTRE